MNLCILCMCIMNEERLLHRMCVCICACVCECVCVCLCVHLCVHVCLHTGTCIPLYYVPVCTYMSCETMYIT